MLKQLVITFALVSFFSAFAIAQESTELVKKEKQECTKMCCANKEMHSDKKMDNSKETVSAKPWNEVCPVMGNKVDPEVPTMEFEGKAYGFCCSGCDEKFRNDPEKYSKNLSEDGRKFLGKR